MALLPPIIQDFQIRPDVSKVHAVAAVLEKHIGALRAELEQFLDPEPARRYRPSRRSGDGPEPVSPGPSSLPCHAWPYPAWPRRATPRQAMPRAGVRDSNPDVCQSPFLPRHTLPCHTTPCSALPGHT